MVYLTRVERFNAAHRLWINEWSAEENFATFGKCANKNWHGHNFFLHVTVKGKPDPVTGFIIDAKKLSRIIKEVIIEKLYYSNLNLDVDFIPSHLQPTSENLVMLIWQQLEPYLNLVGCQLYRIKLIETDYIYAEYYGEKN